jgi:hypothetical protein
MWLGDPCFHDPQQHLFRGLSVGFTSVVHFIVWQNSFSNGNLNGIR